MSKMHKIGYSTLVVIGFAIVSLMFVVNQQSSLVQAQNEEYKAKLLGKNEVPPVNTTTVGRITFKIMNDTVKWRLNITGITNASAAHIYTGRGDENGVPIVDLLKIGRLGENPRGVLVRGEISASDLQGSMAGKTLKDLQSAFNNSTYVNVLTKNHPGGEVRGQIIIQPPVNSTKLQ